MRPRPRAHCGVSTGTSAMIAPVPSRSQVARQPDDVGALRGGKAAARWPTKMTIDWLASCDRDRMAQAIIVGNARGRDLLIGMRAGAQRDGKADERAGDAEGAIAIGGYCALSSFRPCPASVGDEAIGAAIIPRRLDAAGNAVDAVDAAQQIGLRIRGAAKAVIGPRQILLAPPRARRRASPAPSVRSGC